MPSVLIFIVIVTRDDVLQRMRTYVNATTHVNATMHVNALADAVCGSFAHNNDHPL